MQSSYRIPVGLHRAIGVNRCASKGMPSYHVEIREDIIYNRLPLEEQLYTGTRRSTKAQRSQSVHYLFGARFRANLLHGHAWKACRYHSFQRSNWKRAPEASGSFLSCGFEPKFICLQRQKKLKLNFTNQWRFRKKASQLGKESSITSHS